MTLNFLDFDYSEDADGTGTFDAMASALPAQLSSLHSEIAQVLRWAHEQFPDACGALEEGGHWDYDLQAVQEVSTPIALEFDVQSGGLRSSPGVAALPRTTVSLSLSGSAAFCAALRDQFHIA